MESGRVGDSLELVADASSGRVDGCRLSLLRLACLEKWRVVMTWLVEKH